MVERETASFGSWDSPISAADIASGTVKLEQVMFAGSDLYWIEGRAKEGGRNAIIRLSADGSRQDVIEAPFNARTRVHEYGGGDYIAVKNQVFFANFADQQLYRATVGQEPVRLTDCDGLRFADMVFDSTRQRLFFVVEDHRGGGANVINMIGSIKVSDEKVTDVEIVAEGFDFYSNPRLSPDGSRLCWLCWNHPNMPWDGTELWAAELDFDGKIKSSAKIAGGDEESIAVPQWGIEGALYMVSDRSGWWNLYAVRAQDLKLAEGQFDRGRTQRVIEMEAEFAGPQWVFGGSSYACLDDGRLLVAFNVRGSWKLGLVTPDETGRTYSLSEVKSRYTSFGYVKASGRRAAMIAGSPTSFNAVVELDIDAKEFREIRSSSDLRFDEEYISVPETIEFATTGGMDSYAFFYAPKNPDFHAPDGEKPPLLVKSHGGPTSQATNVLSLSIQYWTSRGFAVVDVNYGGSTGFGREYRERLNDNWGVVDVADCQAAARYLSKHGKVEPQKMAISGGSAGGYTTLCALTFGDVFKSGASYYGVSDLVALAQDTHKFESRYLDRLVGPYPERKELYQERSPINYTDRLSCPIIFFQGSEDKVVPPQQSEVMVEALKSRGLAVAYLLFEGEQHGFRKAETITRALEAELYFYSRVFQFKTPSAIAPVEIQNSPVGAV